MYSTNQQAIIRLKPVIDELVQIKSEGIVSMLITQAELVKIVGDQVLEYIEFINGINLQEYGIKSQYLGLDEVPECVVISGQVITEDGKDVVVKDVHVPALAYEQFSRMNEAFKTENSSRSLIVHSAYRSPTYQILVMSRWLKHYDYDLAQTLKHVALPAYSEHCRSVSVALDLGNIEGSPSDNEPDLFVETVEYNWLRANAHAFGFSESFTVGNEWGMRPESWHWRFAA